MLRLVFQDFAYLKAAISEAVRRSPGSAIESSVRDQNFVLWFELVVCCPRLAAWPRGGVMMTWGSRSNRVIARASTRDRSRPMRVVNYEQLVSGCDM